ncbi:hypothetical protein [Nonomuraea insulae]|uniref:Uncharacterized protein n=1 Tax=Nonomuraea insulae TaxID=1616787 RepID=A0ABW1CXP0_9ACTN
MSELLSHHRGRGGQGRELFVGRAAAMFLGAVVAMVSGRFAVSGRPASETTTTTIT